MNPGIVLWPEKNGPGWATLAGEDGDGQDQVWDGALRCNLEIFLEARGLSLFDVLVVPPELLPWALENWSEIAPSLGLTPAGAA